MGVLLPIERTAAESIYDDLVCSYSWDCGRALRVMFCESTNNPRAYAAGNYGLMQINAIHASRAGGSLEALYDPETNIDIAHQLYLAARAQGGTGFEPWAYCGRR